MSEEQIKASELKADVWLTRESYGACELIINSDPFIKGGVWTADGDKRSLITGAFAQAFGSAIDVGTKRKIKSIDFSTGEIVFYLSEEDKMSRLKNAVEEWIQSMRGRGNRCCTQGEENLWNAVTAIGIDWSNP